MSQPFDGRVTVPWLRSLDKKSGEFWVPNPWLFPYSGENLSAYERNMVFLNAGGRRFDDLSFFSGADSEGDGRSATAWDVTGDGMPELFVRQVGGGPLLVFRNCFPQSNWLNVSLRGTKSNRFGVGAKLIAELGGKRICRELYPIVNALSQTPAAVHFSLGQADEVEKLTVRWPSGQVQELRHLPANKHLLIREDDPRPSAVVSGSPLPEP